MNRNDRRIAYGTVCVGVLALIGLWLGGETGPETTNAVGSSDSSLTYRASHTSETKDTSNTSYYAVPSKTVERFPFDPNTADSTQLLRLGLQPWQVRNIYKYRANGGVYRKKEDFARLYGLTVKQYRELEPYIQISNDYLPAATLVGSHGSDGRNGSVGNGETRRDTTLHYPVKIGENEHVVLNFPQEAKKYFVIQHASPKKLNVNKLSLQELRKHPYINYYMAKTIVDYRRLHGDIKSLEDLRLSKDFPSEVIRRLEPYVEY